MSSTNESLVLERPKIIIAALAMSAVGALFYNLLPLILGSAQDYRNLDSSEIGFLGTAFYLGYLLTTITGFFWIRRFNWRMLTQIATPIAIGGLVLAAYSSSYSVLAIGFVLSGGAFSIIYGIAATVIGDMPSASRWYGLKIGIEAGLGAILFLFLPGTIVSQWGFDGLLVAMAVVVVVLMPFAVGLPASGAKHIVDKEDGVDLKGKVKKWPIFISLFVIVLFFTGESAVWAFVERLGNDAGFDSVSVGRILSLTLAFAVAGSLTISYIGDRFGFFKPFVVACLIFFLGLLGLYYSGDSITTYATGACLVMFSVGFGIPIPLSSTAHLDVDGRYVVLTVPAIGLAAMCAPGLAGVINEFGGDEALLLFCAGVVFSSIFLHRLSCKHVHESVYAVGKKCYP